MTIKTGHVSASNAILTKISLLSSIQQIIVIMWRGWRQTLDEWSWRHLLQVEQFHPQETGRSVRTTVGSPHIILPSVKTPIGMSSLGILTGSPTLTLGGFRLPRVDTKTHFFNFTLEACTTLNLLRLSYGETLVVLKRRPTAVREGT